MQRNDLYCQSNIEGEKPCETQCEHCKLYYKPIQNDKGENKKRYRASINILHESLAKSSMPVKEYNGISQQILDLKSALFQDMAIEAFAEVDNYLPNPKFSEFVDRRGITYIGKDALDLAVKRYLMDIFHINEFVE